MMQRDTLPPALFRLGFRPFFIAGALLATLAIPIWIAALTGAIAWQPAGGWLGWHRHEMLFGFAGAIIAGFLLTAVQNWTGVPGPRGKPLMALAGLWLAARVAWLGSAPMWLLLPLELAFLPALAFFIGRSLISVRQSRNYPVLGVLVLLAVADLLVMLGLTLGDDSLARQGNQGALWLIAALIGIVGGRVIPFFTRNGLSLAAAAEPLPWLDNLLLGGSILIALTMFAGPALSPTPWLASIFIVLGVGHLCRLARWYNPGIWKVPLLWSLHLAYGWLAIACLAMACWHLGWHMTFSQATHLLALGGMSGIILAMIARVSLGHTGRPLQAPAVMTVAFVLINLAVPVRIWLPAVSVPGALWLAAAAWTVAFGLFVWHYVPILSRPRPDGGPG
ncbi:NnrS family protein [Halopseudomonas nanhaiensis]|uniref:NnrS family protein n=1 Tax=Halopseudomonas nanhaiensis TaxID=2830842 RepID=UPI001CBC5904|nr:NnrS family protein [Halopseudomonas nanhaiensis]UAW99360.1 NnrS family protein [Halopseudomonas nanhaiensis]